MKSIRACPVCPNCGSKKFERLTGNNPIKVRCVSCKKMLEI